MVSEVQVARKGRALVAYVLQYLLLFRVVVCPVCVSVGVQSPVPWLPLNLAQASSQMHGHLPPRSLLD